MNFRVLETPRFIDFGEKRNTQDEVTSLLREEFNIKTEEYESGHWTDECSVLKKNPQIIYLFDRFEFQLQQAYGLPDCKIALNPLMILCCHPDCIKNAPICRLKHIFDLEDYVKHHVNRHTDLIGKAIRLPYAALALNTAEIRFEGKLYDNVDVSVSQDNSLAITSHIGRANFWNED